jgi:hypothetical protein
MTGKAGRGGRTVRFGLIVSDAGRRADWEEDCLAALLAVPGAELAVIAEVGLEGEPRAGAPAPLAAAGAPRLRCRSISNGPSAHRFSPDDIERLRVFAPDFLLHLGERSLEGEILDLPPFGVWSLRHDDLERRRGGVAGVEEIRRREPVSGTSLDRLTGPAGRVLPLRTGVLRTIDTSWRKNRAQLHRLGLEWPAAVCRDILDGRAGYAHRAPADVGRSDGPGPARGPGPWAALRLRMARNLAGKLWRELACYDQWNIGVVERPIQAFLEPGFRPVVRWLPAPARATFRADPFALAAGGATHVVFEEFDYRRARGRVSALALGRGASEERRGVIVEPFHLSYPYLVESSGRVYCVPEAHEAREVSLYEALEFPVRWRKAATLVPGWAGVDPTLFRWGGRWWLFATDADGGPDHRLAAWHAPELLGPWHPHARNPIKLDVRSARPGGTPFLHEGRLYRPAQDCSTGYGARTVIQHVTRLTPEEFEEQEVAAVAPGSDWPYPDGLHTIAAAGEATLIDAKKRRSALTSWSVLMHNQRALRRKVLR